MDCSPQAPVSLGFSRQQHGSGWPHPPPGGLPAPGVEPVSLRSPALASGFFTPKVTWETLLAATPLLHFCRYRRETRVPTVRARGLGAGQQELRIWGTALPLRKYTCVTFPTADFRFLSKILLVLSPTTHHFICPGLSIVIVLLATSQAK